MNARIMIILLTSSVLLLSGACEDEHGLAPPAAPCASCDTCDNLKLPPTGPWYQDGERVPAVQFTYRGKISPDGMYLAYLGGNSDYRNDERDYPISGLVVQDVATRRVLHFFPGFYSWFAWHPDALHLYYVKGSILCRLNVQTGESIRYDSLGHWEGVNVTGSGRFIYLSGYIDGSNKNGIWRCKEDGSGLSFVTDDVLFKWNYLTVDDSLLCALNIGTTAHPEGVYILNVLSGSVRFIRIPALHEQFSASSYAGSLSRNGKLILFQPYVADKKLNDGYFDAGIWILDLGSTTLRQVLPKHLHYRFSYRNPQWCTDKTFIADWLCVKDSSVSLYEYTLDGRPVRRLTDRNVRFWE